MTARIALEARLHRPPPSALLELGPDLEHLRVEVSFAVGRHSPVTIGRRKETLPLRAQDPLYELESEIFAGALVEHRQALRPDQAARIENHPVKVRIGRNQVRHRELGAAENHIDIARYERVLNTGNVTNQLHIRLGLQQKLPDGIQLFGIEGLWLPALAEGNQLNEWEIIVVDGDPPLVLLVPENVPAPGIGGIDACLVETGSVVTELLRDRVKLTIHAGKRSVAEFCKHVSPWSRRFRQLHEQSLADNPRYVRRIDHENVPVAWLRLLNDRQTGASPFVGLNVDLDPMGLLKGLDKLCIGMIAPSEDVEFTCRACGPRQNERTGAGCQPHQNCSPRRRRTHADGQFLHGFLPLVIEFKGVAAP